MRQALSVKPSSADKPMPVTAMPQTSACKRFERCANDTTLALTSKKLTNAKLAKTVSDRSAHWGELGHRCSAATPVMAASVKPTKAQATA